MVNFVHLQQMRCKQSASYLEGLCVAAWIHRVKGINCTQNKFKDVMHSELRCKPIELEDSCLKLYELFRAACRIWH